MCGEKGHIGMEIKTAANTVRRSFAKRCRENSSHGDVTAANSWILMFIFNRGGEDVFQKDIEEAFSVRGSTMSSMISQLEKKGYIRREPVEYDARLKKLVLTEKARQVCREISEGLDEFEKDLTEGIDKDELEVFRRVLGKIVGNAEAET